MGKNTSVKNCSMACFRSLLFAAQLTAYMVCVNIKCLDVLMLSERKTGNSPCGQSFFAHSYFKDFSACIAPTSYRQLSLQYL